MMKDGWKTRKEMSERTYGYSFNEEGPYINRKKKDDSSDEISLFGLRLNESDT